MHYTSRRAIKLNTHLSRHAIALAPAHMHTSTHAITLTHAHMQVYTWNHAQTLTFTSSHARLTYTHIHKVHACTNECTYTSAQAIALSSIQTTIRKPDESKTLKQVHIRAGMIAPMCVQA